MVPLLHPRAALAVLAVGLISSRLLPLEAMPDITFPGMRIVIPYAGSTPEEMEQLVVRPVEEALAGEMWVRPFPEGEEILARLEAGPIPETCLLDAEMSERDGYAVCNGLRQRNQTGETLTRAKELLL